MVLPPVAICRFLAVASIVPLLIKVRLLSPRPIMPAPAIVLPALVSTAPGTNRDDLIIVIWRQGHFATAA
jgi:hypothetical protein